jgi:hypothetical protein
MCRDALIWAAVPSVLAGSRPGAVGFTHSVGPEFVAGANMA